MKKRGPKIKDQKVFFYNTLMIHLTEDDIEFLNLNDYFECNGGAEIWSKCNHFINDFKRYIVDYPDIHIHSKKRVGSFIQRVCI